MLLVAVAAIACGEKEDDYSDWYGDGDKNQSDPGNSTTPVGDFDLSIMSFNVRYPATEDTGDKSWGARSKGVYAMLKAKKPMIVGLQECYISQRSDITRNVEGYGVYGV